ncbi:probable hexosyltransferase MUCI70 [Prosopis cineraria]|uniref:probable hexosyltransferase MUCI70 n=1 Tax=Prosopis cineraria TaxID=364024 RepID=UPI00241045CC|nr:probable hexosyltransferase MUCI70 [Prosopis cineraria]
MFDNSSNVAISVLDDESDDLGRMRVRARRKRKKLLHRGENGFALRLLKKLLKYWMLLIIIPVVGFLVFEAFIIGTKPGLRVNSQLGTPDEPSQFNLEFNKVDQSTPTLGKDPKSNLNRLDPTSRVIGGVRQRCLKILPPEELEHLDLPMEKDYKDPVNKVLYISESDTYFVGGNTASTQQNSEVMSFNLFTGNQTLHERERSFEVKETMEVHCGFYSSAGGFKITDKDKSYMKACKVVVSTCAFGGGDDLYQPIGMSEASLKKVCYLAFWDEITVRAQELVGHRIGESGFIGKWRVVVVRDLPFSDQRLNGKIPKMLSHRLFPQAEYSIWVDSKSQFRRDPLGVLEALLWRSNFVLAISEHGARGSVYDEAKAVVKKNKATPKEVEVQINQYRKDGLPQDKRFNGKKALSEASIIVRKHTPLTNLLMCLWFNEVVRFTSRDQLSFPYVLWRLKAFEYVNMFPVCTRKDLVNSMGHLRKVKPLQN